MTSSVPYSFVPGTKAKAEEVNANFIALLNQLDEANGKINETNQQLSETNEKITETNSRIDEADEQKANASLDNLDSAGTAVLAAKANNTDIDGKWIGKYYNVFDSRVFAEEATETFSISSYLPNDGNTYEVIISTYIRTGGTYGNAAAAKISTDRVSNLRLCRAITRTSADAIAAGCAIVVVGTGRYIQFLNADASGNSGTCGLTCLAYRKVR